MAVLIVHATFSYQRECASKCAPYDFTIVSPGTEFGTNFSGLFPIRVVEARGSVFASAGLQRAGECRAPSPSKVCASAANGASHVKVYAHSSHISILLLCRRTARTVWAQRPSPNSRMLSRHASPGQPSFTYLFSPASASHPAQLGAQSARFHLVPPTRNAPAIPPSQRLASLHLVTLSPCHRVTVSPCLRVTLSPCPLVTLSVCDLPLALSLHPSSFIPHPLSLLRICCNKITIVLESIQPRRVASLT